MSRRNWLQGTATLAAWGAVSPWVRDSRAQTPRREMNEGDAILFQGDSITDVGRDRQSSGPNDRKGLGGGYAAMAAGAILGTHPEKKLRIYNRGISGNRVPELAKRWTADAIDLKPAILSILIGVNDIWHKMNGKSDGTVEAYEAGYRELLRQALQGIPGVRIVICEPFVLRCGAVTDKWFPEFDRRRAVARKLADEMNLVFVPFQAMFDKATQSADPTFWAQDGVHPSVAGHSLMALTWLETVGI